MMAHPEEHPDHNPEAQPPQDNPQEPQIFSNQKQKDGSYVLSRREFLGIFTVTLGSLVVSQVSRLVDGLDEAVAAAPAPAGEIAPRLRVPVHLQPQAGARVMDLVKPNDLVKYAGQSADGRWVMISGRGQATGWVLREYVDFEHPVRRQAAQDEPATLTPTASPEASATPGQQDPTNAPSSPEASATPGPEERLEAPEAGQMYVLYLPVVLNLGPTPTNTPTSTPCPKHVKPTATYTPTKTPCTCNLNPCSCNAVTPCTCNLNPCACNNITPCTCNNYTPCACNGVTPCTCNAYTPCACNGVTPCSCNAYTPCTCNVAPCVCNLNPCSCNTAPCSCNIAPCVCNYNPCSCNTAPCYCNAFPCACNGFTPCTCNGFTPCTIT
jgi:hypothetical protein